MTSLSTTAPSEAVSNRFADFWLLGWSEYCSLGCDGDCSDVSVAVGGDRNPLHAGRRCLLDVVDILQSPTLHYLVSLRVWARDEIRFPALVQPFGRAFDHDRVLRSSLSEIRHPDLGAPLDHFGQSYLRAGGPRVQTGNTGEPRDRDSEPLCFSDEYYGRVALLQAGFRLRHGVRPL